jgi:high-affinity iron transporter
MNLSDALPTFFVTLREGVEAALVVGIVLAALKKANQSRLNLWVYAGIFVGLLSSALVGAIFLSIIQTLEVANQLYAPVIKPLLEAIISTVAIALLSWMLIWMTQQARQVKSTVESVVDTTLNQGTAAGWGVFSLILAAVLREGFETVLFIAAQFQAGVMPVMGAMGGLVTATGIGVLLFKWGVKINLRLFFQIMGVVLLLIVGGLILSALKNFDAAAATYAQLNPAQDWCIYSEQKAGYVSCILGPLAWDTSAILSDRQFPGIVLRTLFGYRERLYMLQVGSYVLFWLTVGTLYFQSLARSSQASKPSEALKPSTVDASQ